jgi:predicted small integral membrane protein
MGGVIIIRHHHHHLLLLHHQLNKMNRRNIRYRCSHHHRCLLSHQYYQHLILQIVLGVLILVAGISPLKNHNLDDYEDILHVEVFDIGLESIAV